MPESSRSQVLRVAFTTPAAIAREDTDKAAAEEAISSYLPGHPLLLYTDREDAEDAARMAASSGPDEREWEELLGCAVAHGGDLEDARRIARGQEPLGYEPPTPPASYAYVIEVEFDDSVRITSTDERSKTAQLEFSRQNPEWDLLWLPDGLSAGACLRVVTHRELLGHFSYVGSYRVYGQPRRPAS